MSNTNTFSSALVVDTAELISNPKVAPLHGGDALISWTQNRYNSSTFDTTRNLAHLLKAQDIWVTLYDSATNAFAPATQISDILTNPNDLESGKSEGNANIIMGKGNYGLITWVVNNDTMNNNADVWYCTVTTTSTNVVLGTPATLINLPGTNTKINVSYYNDSLAIACWINDPDGNDSTLYQSKKSFRRLTNSI